MQPEAESDSVGEDCGHPCRLVASSCQKAATSLECGILRKVEKLPVARGGRELPLLMSAKGGFHPFASFLHFFFYFYKVQGHVLATLQALWLAFTGLFFCFFFLMGVCV